MDYRTAPLAEVDAVTLYRILWLRVRVFVSRMSTMMRLVLMGEA